MCRFAVLRGTTALLQERTCVCSENAHITTSFIFIHMKNKMIDVKIGSPTEALWTRVRDATKERMKQLEESLVVEKAFLETSERKVLEAQNEFKK